MDYLRAGEGAVIDTLKLRNKLTNGHDLSTAEYDYLKSLIDDNGNYPVKAVAEIVIGELGEVLWVERYIFKRIHGQGETFVRDSRNYEVLTSKITYGAYGGALVEYVVKER